MSNTTVESLSPVPSPEIESAGLAHRTIQIDQGNNAVLLDIRGDNEKGDAGSLKLAKDNHTVLIPQPTDDPEDPLNWSWTKKHMLLFIVALSAFCGDFSSGAGIPCIFSQGAEWDMDPNKVNYAGNLNVIMLGIGGIWWIPCVYFWGRAPVLFWTVLAGTLFTLGCCLAHNFPAFYALRAVQGFTLTSGQTIGLAYIKDMFYFHEHARKIGLWAGLFLLSPYAGPMFANFIINGTGSWRAVFWLVFAICCFDLTLIVLFVDESWYRRDIPQADQPPRGNRLYRLVGYWQIRVHNGYFLPLSTAYLRLWSVVSKPVVTPIMLYQMLSFMWSVGINITSSILLQTPKEFGGYGFGLKAIGFLYLTPIVGVAAGEFFGHFFNDFLVNRYIRTHKGIFKPETRLWTNYIATFFMIPGLVIVGQALEKHLHYSAIIVGWGIYVFGVMLASVAITTYALDSYPTRSGEVSCFLNFARVGGGFTVGYFQQPWGARNGYGVSFGIQALLVGVALMILICLHRFGAAMRARGGPVK